jgi:protein SCO1/2
MARIARLLVMLLFVAGAGLWAATWWREQASPPGALGVAVPGGVEVGGKFTLVAADGHSVSDTDFRGRFMLVYFGYIFCPDVCPTELQAVSASLALLGDQAAKVTPIFITIDPERDTPQAIGEYTRLFDDRLIGLTGTASQIAQAAKVTPIFITIDPERDTPQAIGEYTRLFDDRLIGLTGTASQIAQAAKAYRTYYARVEPKAGGTYLMDHSSFLYLMGPDGKFRALIKPGSTPEDIAALLRAQLARS